MKLEMAEKHGNPRFRHQNFLAGEMLAKFLGDGLERLAETGIVGLGKPGEQPLERFVVPVHQGDAKTRGSHWNSSRMGGESIADIPRTTARPP